MPYFFLVLFVIMAVSVFLLLYPYAVYPWLLTFFPTRPVRRDKNYRCSATLVFCAYNEERSMPEKIANLEALKAQHPDLQILAFDDGSTDATYAQLAARADLLEVVRGPGRSGKAHGMKILAAKSRGDIMVFTDANVTLKEDAIQHLMACYGDPEVGGVCGRLVYVGGEDSATATAGGLYWSLEERLKAEESRSGNTLGADGSIFSLRRELYPSFPDTVLDDLTVSMAAIFAGKRLIKSDDVVAFERLVSGREEEFARKVRIAARAYHTHLYLRPWLAQLGPLDRFKYISRKVIRWFGGLFLVIGIASTVGVLLILSLKLGLLAILLLALLSFMGSRINQGKAAVAIEVVIALVATLIGVAKALRGATFVTWSPATSR